MSCDFIACPVNIRGVCRVDLFLGKEVQNPIHPSCPDGYRQGGNGVAFDSKVDPFKGRIFGNVPVKSYDSSSSSSGDHGGV